MKTPIYFDYSATTPVDPRVAKAMMRYLTPDGIFGNPASRSHSFGWGRGKSRRRIPQTSRRNHQRRPARNYLDFRRNRIEQPGHQSAAHFYKKKGRHIVTIKTEHKAVLDTVRELEREGFSATYLAPEDNGLIDLAKFEAALRDDTALFPSCGSITKLASFNPSPKSAKFAENEGLFLSCRRRQRGQRKECHHANCRTFVHVAHVNAHKVYGTERRGGFICAGRKPRGAITRPNTRRRP